jgi:hypothetical protein
MSGIHGMRRRQSVTLAITNVKGCRLSYIGQRSKPGIGEGERSRWMPCLLLEYAVIFSASDISAKRGRNSEKEKRAIHESTILVRL